MTRSCALVSQEIALFEGTVRQNLTLWDDTIPDEILLRSLEDAAILDVVLFSGGLMAIFWRAEQLARSTAGWRSRGP